MDSRKRSRSERDANSPPSPSDAAVMVQAAYRGFRCRLTHSLPALRREHHHRQAELAEAAAEAALALRRRSPEYRRLARHCPDVDVAKLAAVDARLDALVGLVPLKEYCLSVRRDCLARAALGDAPLVRNVLISGNLGTGKKLAAEVLYELLRALGVAKGMSPTHTTLDQLALDVRRDMSCVIVDSLEQLEAARTRVDQVLGNFPNHCFVFLGAQTSVEALHGAISHFRKVDPAWLQLPNYTPPQLAEIANLRLEQRGYSLTEGLAATDMQAALCGTWARDVLAMRNAHLADELVQRAITNRNRRLPLSALLTAPPRLGACDLGFASSGLDSLLAERAAVDEEIRGLVGMAPLKAMLVELRAKVEFVSRGADPRLLEGCLNVVLTGNPGAGKTTAARLLFRALRAFGLLKSNVFVERNALELKGTHVGWTCPQVKEMVQAALGGCLFLDEAYALSGGGKDGDRGDSFSDEALRTLLTETENNRTSLCVVLAGYREAMEGLLRADPGLVRRFPTTIHLEDYSAAELAAIARQTALSRFGLTFEAGLEERLAAHIAQRHEREIPSHNASLAVALVEAAINRLALRCVGGTPGVRDAARGVEQPASPALAGGLAAHGSVMAATDAAACNSGSGEGPTSASTSASALAPHGGRLPPAEASTLRASDFSMQLAAAGTEASAKSTNHDGRSSTSGTESPSTLSSLSSLSSI